MAVNFAAILEQVLAKQEAEKKKEAQRAAEEKQRAAAAGKAKQRASPSAASEGEDEGSTSSSSSTSSVSSEESLKRKPKSKERTKLAMKEPSVASEASSPVPSATIEREPLDVAASIPSPPATPDYHEKYGDLRTYKYGKDDCMALQAAAAFYIGYVFNGEAMTIKDVETALSECQTAMNIRQYNVYSDENQCPTWLGPRSTGIPKSDIMTPMSEFTFEGKKFRRFPSVSELDAWRLDRRDAALELDSARKYEAQIEPFSENAGNYKELARAHVRACAELAYRELLSAPESVNPSRGFCVAVFRVEGGPFFTLTIRCANGPGDAINWQLLIIAHQGESANYRHWVATIRSPTIDAVIQRIGAPAFENTETKVSLPRLLDRNYRPFRQWLQFAETNVRTAAEFTVGDVKSSPPLEVDYICEGTREGENLAVSDGLNLFYK
jgi:hypothetical protein